MIIANETFEEFMAREVARHKRMILECESIQPVAVIQKQERKTRQLEFKIAKADEEIAFCDDQMRELMRYGEYLRQKKSACASGSDRWYKWNNAILANNAKVRAMKDRMDKAMETKREAEIEMEVA